MQFQLQFSDTEPEHFTERVLAKGNTARWIMRLIADARVAVHWGQGWRFHGEDPYPSCHCTHWQSWPAGVEVAISDDIGQVTCQLCLRDHQRFNDPTHVLGGLAIPRQIGGSKMIV